ncbi:MAG TPA: 2-dehydropantoate 2-reductase [Burkholderiaceae bacterium]
MKIAIVGAGGIGGYFGALLARAGENVHFLVRSHSVPVLREQGITIESAVTPLRLDTVQASDDPASVGAADLVVFAVKLPDAQAAARQVAPLVGPHTVVVPFQNGVESAGLFAGVVPEAQVARGVAYIATALRAPGVVVHSGPFARLLFGALDPLQLPALEAFGRACERARIDARLVPDIRTELWQKFVFLVGLSAMTAVTRMPAGVIRADPDMRAALREVMREAWAVGRAEGVDLGEDFVDGRIAFFDSLPDTMQASMLHDLKAGRPLELPWLSGAVARLGKLHGIATPVNATIVAALKPYAAGAPAG